MNKIKREWFVETVWGKVATVSWGSPGQKPVLMLHGYLDSAATFQPLAELLPDDHYYVSFDFPGHGHSSHLPVGPLPTQVIFIEVVNAVVKHLQWDQYIMITHSLGFIIGMFYHNVFPGRITKMVNLDPYSSIGNYFYFDNEPSFWWQFYYETYYESYGRNFEEHRDMTRDQAIRQVMNTRDLNREQAELVLSRTLVSTGDDSHRHSWQFIAKRIVQLPVHQDIAEYVFTVDTPPMLNVIATINEDHAGLSFSRHVMDTIQRNPNNTVVYLDGPHDFHITEPHKLVPYIGDFLSREDGGVKAKL